MPQIRETGADLVAISPQLPEFSAKIAKRHQLGFDVLSDAGNAVSRQWGLVFNLPDALRQIYQAHKLDLASFNGDASWTLPLPARFVLGRDGRILAADSDPDYTRRPEPEVTLDVLKSI